MTKRFVALTERSTKSLDQIRKDFAIDYALIAVGFASCLLGLIFLLLI
ncbi:MULTISPECIES: hypothetical protein [Rhodopseudomonas]|nr:MULTISPECIES: hypothetical protein [Rhodopseudomonas]MDF3810113.1 hypothetical protein [Rhodopseudomonas sp. BAL398]WOK19293.1 hypothetical protein RBJ75_07185 [Rhodopseudomonas sp. BAL398]